MQDGDRSERSLTWAGCLGARSAPVLIYYRGMTPLTDSQGNQAIDVSPVNQSNWRAVVALEVAPAQQAFVAVPSYYLALCCYGGTWQPLAFTLADQVIGFGMWGVDPADSSCWLGGILIATAFQGRGHGKEAVRQTIATLSKTHGYKDFALSYAAENVRARQVYTSLGFQETGESQDDEWVARLHL